MTPGRLGELGLEEVGLMIDLAYEAERRMDLRFGVLGAALVNALARPKEPVSPADLFPSLDTDRGELPDPDQLRVKIGAAFGLEV